VSLLANAARPDVLAADEAQPVEPLLVGEVDGLRGFFHSSSGAVSAIAPDRLEILEPP
jgi:hypothetical protein